jgi:acyl carrier protein
MNIEDKIREFIIKNLYYAEGATLTDDASFLAEGVIDSMGAMELVAFVESEFEVKVEMSEVIVKNGHPRTAARNRRATSRGSCIPANLVSSSTIRFNASTL